MLPKISTFVKHHSVQILTLIGVIAVAVISFNIGSISALSRLSEPIAIIEPDGLTNPVRDHLEASDETILGDVTPKEPIRDYSSIPVVISVKSTSGAYHFPWCPGAKQIKEENKQEFANEATAIAEGYHLAGNCTR